MDKAIICAVSTPPGCGGIAVIRLSGEGCIKLADRVFFSPSGKKLSDFSPQTIHFGEIRSGNTTVDEVLVSIFHAPHSYTGEDTIEITCHGSIYIQQQILQLLIEKGARSALPGEFTQRAFLNGKMDLSQAEAVADLIASTSAGMHKLAMNQMRGGFSAELTQLRTQLLDFTSLIELELDFSEEDVEFADRSQLRDLADKINKKITDLADSFSAGNAIKNGIPVAIIGKPNVGKSTLLNGLLNEERAIVSDIPGTTRDTIEETINLNGQLFRFIDTAGLRQNTNDQIEAIGIQRSFEKAEKAAIVLYLFDLTNEDIADVVSTSQWLHKLQKPVLMVGTKNDIARKSPMHTSGNVMSIYISCKEPADIERLKNKITSIIDLKSISNHDVIVTNIRHYEALCNAQASIARVIEGLNNNLSGDFLSQDIRECLHYLGEITGGEIATDEVLGNIFSKFCIGK
ncbi:MAG: tRNA uridine-5-carboxymethylaminomethyl(34) synthesis GTPase MnmE [Tannerella sp.]|nr:tRNA uridine-5-carboxymethylaminomethyl(34) synthesis GTPase MnmE [Tannerella sp.]